MVANSIYVQAKMLSFELLVILKSPYPLSHDQNL